MSPILLEDVSACSAFGGRVTAPDSPRCSLPCDPAVPAGLCPCVPVQTGSGTVGKRVLEGLGRHALAALPESATEVLPLLSVGFVHLIRCRLCDGMPAARSIPPFSFPAVPGWFQAPAASSQTPGVRSAHMPQRLGTGSRVPGGTRPTPPQHRLWDRAAGRQEALDSHLLGSQGGEGP